MRPTPECLDHLTGTRFSGAFDAAFEFEPDDWRHRSRFEVLRELSTARRVIHVGFLEHSSDQAIDRASQGKWLHAQLCEVADRCFGVDLDQAEIDKLRERGWEDIAAVDVLAQDHPAFDEHPWDRVLLPEVLEHIDDPVSFLRGLAQRFHGRAKELVITVPNAFTPKAMNRTTRRNVEHINSDHRYWFTPYTLCKVVTSAGLEIENLITCHSNRIKPRKLLERLWHQRHPLNGRRIVLRANL